MLLHSFIMADVEDPYLYAAFPISEWQQTEEGKWIMENVTEAPEFHIAANVDTYGYRVTITGDLKPEAKTYYLLKYK